MYPTMEEVDYYDEDFEIDGIDLEQSNRPADVQPLRNVASKGEGVEDKKKEDASLKYPKLTGEVFKLKGVGEGHASAGYVVKESVGESFDLIDELPGSSTIGRRPSSKV